VSVKFQITLPDPLAAQIQITARRLRVPRAEFIRDCVEHRLRELKNSKRPWDPFASITGIADTDETDLSSRVDEIVYGTDPPEMKGWLPPFVRHDRVRR
jgi:metal-responsive CopG/Arc/MetJ family transcriptional regulator